MKKIVYKIKNIILIGVYENIYVHELLEVDVYQQEKNIDTHTQFS